MKSTSRTRGRRAPKRPPVLVPASDSPEMADRYVVVARSSERSPRTAKLPSETPSPPEPEAVEMSAMRPLLWLFVPLVLVIVYGAISSWLAL